MQCPNPMDDQDPDFSRIRAATASAGVQTANAEAALSGASDNPRFPLAAANAINRGNAIVSLGNDLPAYLDAALGTGIGPSAAFDRASKGAFLAAAALGVIGLVTAAPAVLAAGVAFTAVGFAFAAASQATDPLDNPDCPDDPDPNRPRPPGFPVPFNRPPVSPIIFDLNGDGVQTIGLDQSSTYFDLDADGRAERTSWVTPEDGLLVLDRNGNGTIDDITELFGNETRDGFFELDEFLTEVEINGGVRASDGSLLTEADLRVWRDANSDGISQADEIFTLEQLNIAEIPRVGSTVPLDSTIPADERPDFFGFDENGNRISSIGQGFFADGTPFDVEDIFFNNDPTSVRPSNTSLDPIAAILPDLPGGARFDDLRAVASGNEALRDLILDTVANANSFSGAELRSAVEAIVLEWTGIASQDLPSRGQFIDPEPLALLELIFGETYQQTAGTNSGTSNPGPSAANELRQTYEVVVDKFVTQFASQIFSAQLELALLGDFDPIEALASPYATLTELFYDRDEQTVTTVDFDGLIGAIVDGIPDGTSAEKVAYLDLIGSTLTGLRADQFDAGNDFIETGNDEVFESAVRSAFEVLEDRALREIAVAKVLGANRIVGTDAPTETIETDDPELFRDLNGISTILEGGLGNDTLIGGNGGDIYVFAPGDGLDRVQDNGSENRLIETSRSIAEGGRLGNPGGLDRLVFLDRSVDDVTFVINGANLVLTFADNPGDSVLIPGVFAGDEIENGIEQLIFQDGIIGEAEIAQIIEDGEVEFSSTLPGTPGDDLIEGTSGTNAYLLAEDIGNDTIIADYFDTTVDRLLVNFNKDEVVIASDRNRGAGLLVTTISQTTDINGNTITVRGDDSVFFEDFGFPVGSQRFRYNLRSIQFLDQTDTFFNLLQEVEDSEFVFVPYNFADIELQRGAIDDGGGIGTINDQSNLFITADGEIVEELGFQFSVRSDSGRGFVFEDKRILSQEDVALLVPLENREPDIASELNGSVFAENVLGGTQSDIINAAAGNDTIDAGAGDDEVEAGTGDDLIIGGAGDDRLIGDTASELDFFGSSGLATEGSDTYIYASGDGNDRIAEFGTGQVDRDVLVLSDLNLEDVVFTRIKENDRRPVFFDEDGFDIPSDDPREVDNLIITDTTTGHSITVEGQFSSDLFGLEAIQFADGTLLEREDILSRVVLTDDTSDRSDGTTLSGRGLIYGGAQFSSIVGTSGTFGSTIPLGLISLDQLPEFDTAVFDENSISQTISGIEVVEFRDAISSEVTIARDPFGALVLTLDTTGQQVRVDNFFFDPTTTDLTEVIDRSSIGAETSLRFIQFADGELFTVDDIADLAVLSGTDGDDTIEVDGLGGLVAGGLGSDIIEGSENVDRIDGGEGDDQLSGGRGDDVFEVRDGDGNDLVDGERGFDTYDATFSTLAVNVSLEDEDPGDRDGDLVSLPIGPSPIGPIDPGDTPLSPSGLATFADGTIDELISIERVIGGRTDDVISGSSVDETFIGNDGNDQLIGNGGDDTLAGGRGADILDGGQGLDTADYSRARFGVTLSIAAGVGTSGEAEGDVLVSIENVLGSNFADNIEGDDQGNSITLGRGDDIASGKAGNDLIFGNDGDDVISGEADDDELDGGAGNDEIFGGDGDDLLTGGVGDDLLNGGFGSDVYFIGHENSVDLLDDAGSQAADSDLLILTELNADQVELIRDRDNLIVNFDVFGSVTILGQFRGDGSGVENIEFADGSIIDRDDITATAGSRLLGPILAFDDLGFSSAGGSPFSISAEELLLNDLNIDGGALILSDVSDATNGNATIDSDGNVVFTPLAGFVGVATFNYSVTDGFGAFETATVEIEFTEGQGNAAPIVVEPLDDVSVSEDTAISAAIPADAFADADGDSLVLSASLADGSDLPEWLTFDGTAFTGIPPQDFNGFIDLTVTASDGALTATDTFRLNIDPVNDAPIVVQPLADQSGRQGRFITFVVPGDSFADVDGDTLSYSATLADGSTLPEWLTFDEQTLTFSGTPPTDLTGSLDLAVTASDGELSAQSIFSLSVVAGGDYTIFRQDISSSVYSVELIDGVPTYLVDGNTVADLNAFVDAAVVSLGGVRERSGRIQEKALEHFGDSTNPAVRQNVSGAETDVIISGAGVGGQYRAGFADPANAGVFEAFANDLLGRDPAQTKVFEFVGNTNGGSNTIRIFENDEITVLNGDGFVTVDSYLFEWSGADTAGTQRTTDHDTFIERMGELFGGIQESDADLFGFFGTTQANLTGVQSDQVTISGNGADGAEIWLFGSRGGAESFRDFFESLGSIADVGSQPSALSMNSLSSAVSFSANRGVQSTSSLNEWSDAQLTPKMRRVNQASNFLFGSFTAGDLAEMLQTRDAAAISELFDRFDRERIGHYLATSQFRDETRFESRDRWQNGQRMHVMPEQKVLLEGLNAAAPVREKEGDVDVELSRKLMMIRQDMAAFGSGGGVEAGRIYEERTRYVDLFA